MGKQFFIYTIFMILIILSFYLVITSHWINNEGFQTTPTQMTMPSQTIPSQTIPGLTMPSLTMPSLTMPSQTIKPIISNMNSLDYVSAPNNSNIPKTSVSIYEKGINDTIDASINKIQTLMLANPPPSKEKVDQYKKDIASLQTQKTTYGSDNKTSNSAYNSDNYNMSYHADPAVDSKDESTAGPGKMWVKDKTGKLIAIPYNEAKNTTLYYQTGSYPFGPSSYVPNYQESVFLSKLSNSPTTSNVYDTAKQKGGFCAATESSVIEREKKCMALPADICSATECCVSFGGQKCVAGGISGPSIKSNYSDFLITNKDYYYFKGKCYGNCV